MEWIPRAAHALHRRVDMRWKYASIVVVLLLAAGCSDKSTPTAPSPPNLTGTWSGALTLQDTPAQMKWTLAQSGTAVSGPVLVLLPTGVVLMNGSLTGTLSGTTLTYTIAVSPGGIPSNPACTGQLDGTAAVTSGAAPTLTGTYALKSSTCTTGFTSGTFTLTRQ